MTFTRNKKIGNNTYAYEVTAYYDKERKKSRQHVKYVGKVTENGVQKKRTTSAPRTAFNYGDIAVPYEISRKLDIPRLLEESYEKDLADIIRTLAIGKVVRPVSLSNFKSWYENTYLQKLLPLSNPTSQNLSRYLQKIGEDEYALQQFFKVWQEKIGRQSTLTYDITSLSSNSKLIEMLEWGYNRDGKNLPQINLGMVVSEENNIPLYFKIFPGSIADVTTLKNLLMEIQTLGMSNTQFVLDRGFFSNDNIKGMLDEKLGFVIPYPFRYKEAKNIISKTNATLESPEHAVEFKGNILYVDEGEIGFGEKMVKYYIYLDATRRTQEINNLYHRLMAVEEKLDGRKLRTWDNAEAILKDTAGNLSSYFSWSVKDGEMMVTRKPKAISRITNRKGKTIIFYTGDKTWDEVLMLYRCRDIVEKMFRYMKNDLEGLPLRSHKEKTMKGNLVVIFIAMILLFGLLKRMKDSGLTKTYSVEGLFLELAKVKKIELMDGTVLTSEVPKKSMKILDALGLKNIVPKR